MRLTTGWMRRACENVAMAGLLATARAAVRRGSVQRIMSISDSLATGLRWVTPCRENHDTLARGRALATRWSSWVPGATCLHRALATRVWLAAFRVDSRIVLGFRRHDSLTGHAWLEVDLGDGVAVLFHDDPDGYVVAMVG